MNASSVTMALALRPAVRVPLYSHSYESLDSMTVERLPGRRADLQRSVTHVWHSRLSQLVRIECGEAELLILLLGGWQMLDPDRSIAQDLPVRVEELSGDPTGVMKHREAGGVREFGAED